MGDSIVVYVTEWEMCMQQRLVLFLICIDVDDKLVNLASDYPEMLVLLCRAHLPSSPFLLIISTSIHLMGGRVYFAHTTETRILPFILGSRHCPKMMFASGSASSRIIDAAWSTSASVMSSDPVMLMST